MKFKNPIIEKLYDYLSLKSKEAYKDKLLISNVVLSKQETRGRVFETYLAGETPLPTSFYLFTKKIIVYLIKNSISFVLCLIAALFHRFSGQKFRIEDGVDYVLLDTFFIIDLILNEGKFKDTYFPGLPEYLSDKNIDYVYVPKWFGFNHPLKLLRIFKIFKKNHTPVLTHFQVLTLTDYLDTVRFIFLYPFSIFRFSRKLASSYEDKVLCGGLWSAFDDVAYESHMRYLFARRLTTLKFSKIKCISWYENLGADKNFYRGLRGFSGKTEIIGAQLYLRPHTVMNIFPDQNDIPFNLMPDKILVNGPGFYYDLDQVKVGVGPALRYNHLFKDGQEESLSGEIVLVVLPYWDHLARDILGIIRDVDWPKPVKIKFHPTMNWKNYKEMIPKKFTVTSESIQTLLSQAFIVVGNSTGAIVEALALGIPVISVNKASSINHDFMPEIGKGIIWDRAENAEGVRKLIAQFKNTMGKNSTQLKEEGVRIRSFCFSEPTDELIGQAFELG